MNSKTIFLCLAFTAILSFGCEKEYEPKPLPEPGYPTTYKPLTQAEWAARNAEFQKINNYDGLNLNAYGFVEGEIPLGKEDSLTAAFVLQKIEYVIEGYKSFLGISETQPINLSNDVTIHIPGYTGGSSTLVEYYFQTMEEFKKEDFWPEIKSEFAVQTYFLLQHTIAGKKFNGTNIYFTFDSNRHSLKIEKNWFPKAHIPGNEIYTLADALAITCRFIKNENGIDLWEKKHTFRSSKEFILNYTNSPIEVRECWKIETDELDGINYLFIDTQTGEILRWCIECYYI